MQMDARPHDAHWAASPGGPSACMLRVQQAINAHDLDALTACFASDYRSEFPTHSGRAFHGPRQLRANWSRIFGLVPDIQAELLRVAEDGDTVWTEWEWRGTQVDGLPFHQRGVTIQEVCDARIVWVRLYIEPVDARGHDILDPSGTAPA